MVHYSHHVAGKNHGRDIGIVFSRFFKGLVMDKTSFAAEHRYTVAWRNAAGKTVPLSFYVHRTHEQFMVVRITGAEGLLRKLAYGDVERIVAAEAVPESQRRYTPAAMLDEKVWRSRSEMAHYASSPALGK